METTDVVVVGGGPVGLMLATELGLAGVRVVVLERRTDIDPTIKAGSLNVPTLEALDRRGFTPALSEARAANLERFAAFMKQRAGAGAAAATPPARFVGHFGGITLDAIRLDPDDPDLAAGRSLATHALVTQQQLEEILERRARDLGVDLRRGVTLEGFTEAGEAVAVTTSSATIRARWLVGCDGGRSLVRKLAGFEFPGTPPEITAYQAMARIEDTETLRPGWNITDTGVYAFGPMPGRILVAEFGGAPNDRDAPVTPSELEAAVRRVTGVAVRIPSIDTATRFTDNARQATAYRMGRVLLAGDAAHVHSPFGGQGLNLGIGDAVNLGWKLAAAVAGWAPDGLLDTYTAERHPIGAWVLDWTRAQIAIMRPDRHARAIRRVVESLAGTVAGTTYLAKRISGVWQGYDLGGEHPLVGRSAPGLDQRDGRALLLCAAGDRGPREAAGGYAGRLEVRDTTGEAMLVRPDGIVAWVDTGGDDLAKHLTRWLGDPGGPPPHSPSA